MIVSLKKSQVVLYGKKILCLLQIFYLKTCEKTIYPDPPWQAGLTQEAWDVGQAAASQMVRTPSVLSPQH